MLDLTAYDAFILDMDGTLVDSGKYHARAFADAVFNQCGYTLTPAEHYEFFASHSMPYAAELNARYGLTLDPAAVLEEKRARMTQIYVPELFDGAKDFLDDWYGQRPLALATNSPADFTRDTLTRAGIISYFACVVTSDDVTERKPDPEMLQLAARQLGTAPGRTLVFDDQMLGIDAARRAGMPVIAVDNGQPVSFPSEIPKATWKDLPRP